MALNSGEGTHSPVWIVTQVSSGASGRSRGGGTGAFARAAGSGPEAGWAGPRPAGAPSGRPTRHWPSTRSTRPEGGDREKLSGSSIRTLPHCAGHGNAGPQPAAWRIGTGTPCREIPPTDPAIPHFSYSPSPEGLDSPQHDGGDGLERRPPAGTARRRRAAGRTPSSEVAPSRRESQRSAGSVHWSGRHRLSQCGPLPAFCEGGRQGTARDPGGRCVGSHRDNPHDRSVCTPSRAENAAALTLAWCRVIRAGFALPRVPAGGRRSKPSPP